MIAFGRPELNLYGTLQALVYDMLPDDDDELMLNVLRCQMTY